jgi:hypothetical protein
MDRGPAFDGEPPPSLLRHKDREGFNLMAWRCRRHRHRTLFPSADPFQRDQIQDGISGESGGLRPNPPRDPEPL